MSSSLAKVEWNKEYISLESPERKYLSARTAESFLRAERKMLSGVFPGKLGFRVNSDSPESKFLSGPESGQCPKSGKEFSFPERHFLSGKIRGKIGVAIRTARKGNFFPVRKADSVLRAERKTAFRAFPGQISAGRDILSSHFIARGLNFS